MTERLHAAIVMMPDASGNFMRYQHFATGPVTPGETAPDKEGEPLLCHYPMGNAIMTYTAGAFRHPTTGKQWAAPIKWAYITWEPVDDTIYDSTGPYQPESRGLWLYDTMKLVAKFHKLVDVMAIIDRLEWGNPEEGVPEE